MNTRTLVLAVVVLVVGGFAVTGVVAGGSASGGNPVGAESAVDGTSVSAAVTQQSCTGEVTMTDVTGTEVTVERSEDMDVVALQPSDAQIQEARQLAQQFFKNLKGELQSAIKEGGPVHAIDVCEEVAPGISGKLSTKSGWAVGRTALKVRNPRNSPSVRERAVLMDFKQRAEDGESLKGMEDATIIQEGNRRYLHYMKAIPTGKLCLNCHGSELEPGVAAKIDRLYPEDEARGFALGDIRGAFTLQKPL